MATRLERALMATAVVVNAATCGAAAAEQPDSTQRTAQIQFVPGSEQQWVAAAVEGAARRLRDPRCQEVLSDFTDAQGRTLAAGLTERGVSPTDHLRTVWFLDGRGYPACAKRSTDAFSVTGGRLVFVCPTLLRRSVGKHDEILMIHEVLHTMGLGENPPKSDDITNQVAKRCGAF